MNKLKKKKAKYEHGPVGDWKRTRKKIDKMRKHCADLLHEQGTCNTGDTVEVDYFALEDICEFFDRADYNMQQLAKIIELQKYMC